jgi:hypothetical protein
VPAASATLPLPTPSPADVSAAPPGPTDPGTTPPAVPQDETLLAILPPQVDGIAVMVEPQALAEAAADPDFVASVRSAVFAVVVDGNDLASGVVARLKPGVYSEAFFRDWRDSYNAGACAQAGGLGGNAEADIGGRTVYIASCAGGLLVYHAYLPERGVVVSLFSLGERRFGEQLMGGLRP